MNTAREYLDAVRRPDQEANRLFRFLGIELRELGPDTAELFMPFQEGFLQGGKVIAGGILATLLDEAMAHAALNTLGPGETTATVDLNVRYLKPAPPGRSLTATARVIRRGGTIIHLEAEASTMDKAGNRTVVAAATAAFLVIGQKE